MRVGFVLAENGSAHVDDPEAVEEAKRKEMAAKLKATVDDLKYEKMREIRDYYTMEEDAEAGLFGKAKKLKKKKKRREGLKSGKVREKDVDEDYDGDIVMKGEGMIRQCQLCGR